jgi:hypothetical protein
MEDWLSARSAGTGTAKLGKGRVNAVAGPLFEVFAMSERRERDGQTSLLDPRWDPKQQQLDEVAEDE